MQRKRGSELGKGHAHRHGILFVIAVVLAGEITTSAGSAGTLGLAPPSGHWVYRLPNSEQTRLVSITVSVSDHAGKPVPGATVLAYCEPWDYVVQTETDQAGCAIVRGPVGDWTFCAGASVSPGQGFLATLRGLKVTGDTIGKVTATHQIDVRFLNERGDPFMADVAAERRARRGRPAEIDFAAADLPSPVPAIAAGTTVNGCVRLSVTPDMKGLIRLAKGPATDAPGYVIIEPFSTSKSTDFSVAQTRLGRLTIGFDGYNKGDTRVAVGFLPIDGESTDALWPLPSVPAPPGGAGCTFLVSAGEYQVSARLRGGISVIPHTLTFAPGSASALRYGGKFEARLNVLVWKETFLELWFDIVDDRGNYVRVSAPGAGLRLSRDGETLFAGTGALGRGVQSFKIEREWGSPRQREGIAYEYSLVTDPMGALALRGILPTDRGALLYRQLPLVFASEHFEVRYRDDLPEAARRVAEALEVVHEWFAKHYAGPIRLRSRDGAERRWIVEGIKASGGSAGSGGGINMYVYAANTLDPRVLNTATRVLFHEYGHQYQGASPHVYDPAFVGKDASESGACLMGDYCIRLLHGERGYRWAHQDRSRRFFRRLTEDTKAQDQQEGADEADDVEEGQGDMLLFIHHYIHGRYGQKVNRDFFRATYTSDGNWEQVLRLADFLETQPARAAALYSFLTGDNLAWLYRWAGFKVEDAKVDRALVYFKERGASMPER